MNFKLFVLAAFLLTAAACASQPTAGKLDRSEEIRSVRNSVVLISTQLIKDKKIELVKIGSGFFVSDKYVVTARHVWRDMDDVRTELGGREKADIVITQRALDGSAEFAVPVKYVSVDEENDLAILSFEADEIHKQWQDFKVQPLKLDENLPTIGDEILLTGYFDRFTQPFSSIGTVSMITEDKFKLENLSLNRAIVSDLTAIPGHSGGPVYSFQTHKVVGVLSRVLTPNQTISGISISTNSLHVMKLLDKFTPADAGNSNKQ